MPTIPETSPILGFTEEPLTVCLRSEYRRCSFYVVVGFSLAAVLAAVLPPQRTWWPMAFFVAPSVLLWLYVQTWRLRIDRTGLARRRLGVWTSWTWNLFTNGTVRVTDNSLAFRCPARPWWDRWLLLEFVDPDVAVGLARFCHGLMPKPAAAADSLIAVAVPTEVIIGFGFFRRLRLTSQGIELRDGRDLRQLNWDSVLTLRLVREKLKHVVVSRLVLRLQSGGEVLGGVNFVLIDGQRIWNIAKPGADWLQRLASLVPPRCWQVFQTFGAIQTREEGEFRLAHWQKKRTMMRRLRVWVPLACLALTGIVLVPKLVACWKDPFNPPFWKAVALTCVVLMTIQPAVLFWALFYHLVGLFAGKIRETDEELARFSSTDN